MPLCLVILAIHPNSPNISPQLLHIFHRGRMNSFWRRRLALSRRARVARGRSDWSGLDSEVGRFSVRASARLVKAVLSIWPCRLRGEPGLFRSLNHRYCSCLLSPWLQSMPWDFLRKPTAGLHLLMQKARNPALAARPLLLVLWDSAAPATLANVLQGH